MTVRPTFMLWPGDLARIERVAADVRSDDLAVYLADRVVLWTPIRLPNGDVVSLLMLRPSLRQSGQPELVQ